MPEPVEGTSPYLPSLDGLRAVAVLAVIAFHLGFSWAGGGLLGVGVFFVISGYLITDLLAAEHRRSGGIGLRNFWIRRARRLLPALFVMLFLVVGWVTLFDRAQLPVVRSDLAPAVFYYSNWWFIFQHVSYFARFGPPSPLGHLWSLAIEEQFYLVWPFVMVAGLRWVRSRRIMISLVLLAAVASAVEMAVLFSPYSDPTRVYDATDTRAFALLVGAALALALPRARTFAPVTAGGRRVLDALGVGALAGIFVMFWRTGEYDPFLYRGGMALLSVLTALVIVVVVHPGARLGRALSVEPLRWIGERSYGIYLWHYPVIVLTTPANAAPDAARAALQLAASVGLAALSWRYIEQPVRRGALARAWHGLRHRRFGWPPRLRPAQWALVGGASANAVVCLVGLCGLVSAPTLAASARARTVLPPSHHPKAAATRTLASSAPPPAGQGVTAIGDSVMVDAATDLTRLLPGIVIDAKIGQQLYEVQNTVPALKAAGDVGTRLVIELGTNGPYSATQLVTLLDSLGPKKEIVLINTRVPQPWQTQVNATIASVAQHYPHATLLNWYAKSAGEPQDFYTDGVHLNPGGAQYFASLIAEALAAGAPAPTAHDRAGSRP